MKPTRLRSLCATVVAAGVLGAGPWGPPRILAQPLVPVLQPQGQASGDRFGAAIASIGDFDGDGFGDLLVGAPDTNPGNMTQAGAAHVFLGGPDFDDVPDRSYFGSVSEGQLGDAVAPAGDFDADGFADFLAAENSVVRVYFGGTPPDSLFISVPSFAPAVSPAGDFNQDGFDDIVIGAQSINNPGMAFVYFGGPGADGVADRILNGPQPGDRFGAAVAGGFDFNGDGISDIAVGAPQAGGPTGSGAVRIYFGSAAADAVFDLQVDGVSPGDRFGSALAAAGDMNGDAADDLAVGAPNHSAGALINTGILHVYFGGPAPDGVPDIVVEGFLDQGRLGTAMAVAGDMNDDGFGDLAFGWPFLSSTPNPPAVHVLLGGVAPDNASDLFVEGVPGSRFGAALAPASDLTGDGIDDFPVGAPDDAPGGPAVGRVFVFTTAEAWRNEAEGALEQPVESRGVAWGRLGEDSLPDLYVTRSAPNLLLANDAAGFEALTSPPAGDPDGGAGAVWGDADGDGDLDLWFSRAGSAAALLANDGGALVAAAPGALALTAAAGVSFADYDGDGDLDGFAARDGQPDALLRNDAGVFVDATPPVLATTSPSVVGLWCDVDGDGDQDLFVGKRGATNRLFVNEGGAFTEDLRSSDLRQAGFLGGAAFGDYDNDGDPDLFLSCYEEFSLTTDSRLLANDGGVFTEDPTSNEEWGGLQGKAAVWLDFDNDTLLDLYVATRGGGAMLFHNTGNGFAGGAPLHFRTFGDAEGAAAADYDGDGRVDLVQAFADAPDRLYRNLLPDAGNRLRIALEGTVSNSGGVGARVRVTAAGVSMTRFLDGGSGVFSQNEQVLHFGLGSETTADTVEVRWPSGRVDVMTGVGGNQELTIVETQPQPGCGVDPPSLAFGDIDLGQSRNLPVTLTNTGETDLSGTVSIAGCPEFEIVGPPDYFLSTGQSVQFGVLFTPAADSAYSCVLDPGNGACGQVTMTGTGVQVQEPSCLVQPPSLGFGDVEVGDTKDLALSIINSGDIELRGTVGLQGCAAGFTLAGDPDYAIAPGDSRTFILTFAPTDEVSLSCVLDLGNAACGGVPVDGTGVPPRVTSCGVDDRSLDFGDVTSGSSKELSFTVSNTGDTRLTGNVSAAGRTCTAFSVVGSDAYDLGPGESRKFTVEFSPTFLDSASCTLSLGDECGTVVLRGFGTDVPVPQCTAAPDTLEFGPVTLGQSIEREFLIENTGPVTIAGTVAVDPDCGVFTLAGAGDYSLEPAESMQIPVRFAPAFEGEVSCTVDLGNDVCEPVVVRGTGTEITAVTVPVPPFETRVHQLWSMPVLVQDPDGARLTDVFGFAFGAMSALTWRGFSQTGDAVIEDPGLAAGRGYWVNTVLPLPPGFTLTGLPWGETLALAAGWNLVGTPTPDALAMSRLTFADGGDIIPAAAAVEAGWIGGEVLAYTDATPDLINNGVFVPTDLLTTTIEPFTARLVFAFRPLILGFPPPSGGGAAPDPPGPAAPAAWAVRLTVRDPQNRSSSVILGARRGASLHRDAFDAPEPPLPPGGGLRLSVDHRSWPGHAGGYRTSFVPETAVPPVNRLRVEGAAGPLELLADGLDSLPEGWVLAVWRTGGTRHELGGGEVLDLRGGTTEFSARVGPVAADGGTPRPHLTIHPNPSIGGAVRLGIVAEAAGPAVLRVYGPRGRLVSEQPLALQAGANEVTWGGLGTHGAPPPAGIYHVQVVTATSEVSGRFVRLR